MRRTNQPTDPFHGFVVLFCVVLFCCVVFPLGGLLCSLLFEVQIRVRSGDSVVPDLAFERRTT